jgi:hypothetical protein
VCHSKQQSVLVEHGQGEESARNNLNASSVIGVYPAMVSWARTPLNATMWAGAKVGDVREFLLQRQTQGVYPGTSAPVIAPWRTVVALMMSRGDRCRVSVRDPR